MAAPPLIDAKRLAPGIAAGTVCVLDASFHAVSTGRDARAEFEQGHVPTARFFDLAKAADPKSDLAHTLPTPDHFAACAASVGAKRDRTVVYDNAGMAPSARAWWMLVTFGYSDVHVLDGGLRAWEREGGALEPGWPPPVRQVAEELPQADSGKVVDYRGVQRALASGKVVLDARSSARFHGDAAEPIAGVPSGHIAGSINLPFHDLLDEAGGSFAPPHVLSERFARAGVDMRKSVVCSCGSGVTACVLALALETLGHPAVAVYDGSWTDWTKRHFQGAPS